MSENYKRYTKNDNAPGGFMEKGERKMGEAKKKLAKKMLYDIGAKSHGKEKAAQLSKQAFKNRNK